MINTLFRTIGYILLFMLIQILFLNNIHFLRIATPFLYIYIILKFPVNISRNSILCLSFLIGLIMDIFSNTLGMHTAVCTLIGFMRNPIIPILVQKKLKESAIPSFHTFGFGAFVRYTAILTLVHQTCLFLLEALSLFDFAFLALRVVSCFIATCLLILVTETFYPKNYKKNASTN